MSNRLTNLIKEIRPNATWDIIKWIGLGVATMIGLLAAAIVQRLQGIPYDLIGILILGVVWFAIVIIVYAIGRYIGQKAKSTQNVTEDLNAEDTKTIEKVTEQLRLITKERDAFEKHRDSVIKAHEEARRKIERLERNEIGLSMSLNSRISELEKLKWLHDIAKGDRASIRQLVCAKIRKPEHFSMECEDAPYIEFEVTVLNASVYTVTVQDDVKGRISYREPDYLLSAAPTITENKATELQHGNVGAFKLYQCLVPHECNLMRKHNTENEKNSAYTTVNLQKISIHFTVDFQDGTTETVKLNLPPTADLPLWSG